MYTITEKIAISAGTIRAQARNLGHKTLNKIDADKIWCEYGLTSPTKVVGAFYTEATERQAVRVLNQAIRGFYP